MTLLHVRETPPRMTERGTIVAIPGLAESAESLEATAEHWSSLGFRVLAIDPRGHGKSPRWTPDLLAKHPGDVIVDEILATLSDLHPTGPLVLFGHSAGGSAAAAVAARLRDRVTAVVLEDPFWRLPVTEHQDRDVAEAAARWLSGQQAMGDDARQHEAAARFPRWPNDELTGWSQSKAEMDVSLVRNGDVIPSRAWPTLLAELRDAGVPVLIVTGTIQIGNTPSHRAIERRLGAQVEVFDGATHFIRRDERTRFHTITDAFINTAIASSSRIS